MPKTPNEAAIRKEAAEAKIRENRDEVEALVAAFELPKRVLDYLEALFLVSLLRGYKSAVARATSSLEAGKSRARELFPDLGLQELSFKRSNVRLDPDISFDKGVKGQDQYRDLLNHFDHKWVSAHVQVVRLIVPEYTIQVRTYPAGEGDEEAVESTRTVPAHSENVYSFVGDFTTEEKLAITAILGNTVKVAIGGISDRASAGKPRKGQKA